MNQNELKDHERLRIAKGRNEKRNYQGAPEAELKRAKALLKDSFAVDTSIEGFGQFENLCDESRRVQHAAEFAALPQDVRKRAIAEHKAEMARAGKSEPNPAKPTRLEDTADVAQDARLKAQLDTLEGRDFLNYKEAEKLLGIKERRRRQAIEEGKLTVAGKGRNKKITAASLKDYLVGTVPTKETR